MHSSQSAVFVPTCSQERGGFSLLFNILFGQEQVFWKSNKVVRGVRWRKLFSTAVQEGGGTKCMGTMCTKSAHEAKKLKDHVLKQLVRLPFLVTCS